MENPIIEYQLQRIELRLNHLHYLLHELLARQATGIDPAALKDSEERLRASAKALKKAMDAASIG